MVWVKRHTLTTQELIDSQLSLIQMLNGAFAHRCQKLRRFLARHRYLTTRDESRLLGVRASWQIINACMSEEVKAKSEEPGHSHRTEDSIFNLPL